MKGYGDFKRIAAVIIPDDTTYKERYDKQTEKIVSENALNEMKGKQYSIILTHQVLGRCNFMVMVQWGQVLCVTLSLRRLFNLIAKWYNNFDDTIIISSSMALQIPIIQLFFFLLSFSAANFTLPSTDFGWFDEVIYTELNEEEAKKKVQEFNEKGKKAVKERERDNDRGDRRRGMNQFTLDFMRNNSQIETESQSAACEIIACFMR